MALISSGTGSDKLSAGTTAQRPTLTASDVGSLRYNTDNTEFEKWDGTQWVPLSASVEVGTTAPTNPTSGDLWWNSDDTSGRLFVYYEDANSSQWVEASPLGPDYDDTYLKLDASNDPVTGDLEVNSRLIVSGGSDDLSNTTDVIIYQDGFQALGADRMKFYDTGAMSFNGDSLIDADTITALTSRVSGSTLPTTSRGFAVRGSLEISSGGGGNKLGLYSQQDGGTSYSSAYTTDFISALAAGLYAPGNDGAGTDYESVNEYAFCSVGRFLATGAPGSAASNVGSPYPATTNYGYFSDLSPDANDTSKDVWSNYHSGTAANHFNGATYFNTEVTPSTSGVEGTQISESGVSIRRVSSTNAARCMTLYRESASAGVYIRFQDDATLTGSISINGSGTAYNTTSDYRLKENVVEVSNATDKLKALKPCNFNFIANPDIAVDGFLAHEVQEVVPEAVTGSKDAVDEEGVPEYQGIDQSKLVPLLTKALQEALTKIDDLESRLSALES